MRLSRLLVPVLIMFTYFLMSAETANAGLFDRFKDIYRAPDRLEELQEHYEATKQALEGQLNEQLEQLELSRQQAQELLQRQDELWQSNESFREANEAIRLQNEEYRLQNEQYRMINEAYREQNEIILAENGALLERMERAENERKALYRKAVIAGGAVVALLAAYALSVRIWRYFVWRKQGRDGQGAMLG